MFTLRHLLPFLTTALFLYACTKDNDLPEAGGERLQKIIFQSDSMLQVAFFYDEQGRLTTIEDSNSQSHIARTLIQYNDQSKMVKVTQSRYFGTRSNLLHQFTDTFLYDNNNRIVKRQMLSSGTATGTPAYTTVSTYGYDGQGRLVGDTTHSSYYNGIVAYTTYTYDGNDNIVQTESFSRTSSGGWRSNGITAATYSTQQNPFQSLGMPTYMFVWENDRMLSKHLRTHLSYPDGTTEDYSYENYSNGLPWKITDTRKSQNYTARATIEFSYQ